jgi:hypothetical protein
MACLEGGELMFRFIHIASFFLLPLFWASAISAQQNTPPAEHPPDRMVLDVVVTEKSGHYVL